MSAYEKCLINNMKMKGFSKKFSKQQKLLLIQSRLALESEYEKCQMCPRKISILWKQIHNQLIEKDVSMKIFSLKQLMQVYRYHLNIYKTIKTEGVSKGKLKSEIFDVFEQSYAAPAADTADEQLKLNKTRNEIKRLILNARLSRQAQFKHLSQQCRSLLWQQILDEVKAKAVVGTEALNSQTIQKIFYTLQTQYRKHKRKRNDSSWPFFQQMDQIYGHDKEWQQGESTRLPNVSNELKELVINARLLREADFRKSSSPLYRNALWLQILHEVKDQIRLCCTEELSSQQIQLIFNRMLYTYKRQKKYGRKTCWPYFDQMDQVYGNYQPSENCTTMASDSGYVVCNDDSLSITRSTISTYNLLKILKEKANSDRKMFQQIFDIENKKLQLQKAEIGELRRLENLLKTKKTK